MKETQNCQLYAEVAQHTRPQSLTADPQWALSWNSVNRAACRLKHTALQFRRVLTGSTVKRPRQDGYKGKVHLNHRDLSCEAQTGQPEDRDSSLDSRLHLFNVRMRY